jgi:hypothetical protein
MSMPWRPRKAMMSGSSSLGAAAAALPPMVAAAPTRGAAAARGTRSGARGSSTGVACALRFALPPRGPNALPQFSRRARRALAKDGGLRCVGARAAPRLANLAAFEGAKETGALHVRCAARADANFTPAPLGR